MSNNIQGAYTSIWTGGIIIRMPCELDPETGEVFHENVVVDQSFNRLYNERLEGFDGNEYEICTTCHRFILENEVCSGRKCESRA